MRHPDGVWAGYTYEWNDTETAATRVRGGKAKTVGSQTWIYPSEGECMQCHTAAAGFSLGLETGQMNRDFDHGSGPENQLDYLDNLGLLNPSPANPGILPALPNPIGGSGSLQDRAKAYLHTNCAQCHQPNGGTQSTMDLRYATQLAAMNICNVPPILGEQGIPGSLLVDPGDAGNSILLNRISRRDSAGMPPIGSAVVDPAGVALIAGWVNSLGGC